MKLRFQKAPWNKEKIDRVKFIYENYVLSQHEPRGNGLFFQNEIKERGYFSFRSGVSVLGRQSNSVTQAETEFILCGCACRFLIRRIACSCFSHWLFTLLFSQMLAPPHCLHTLLRRLCSQKLPPPHKRQCVLSRLCGHFARTFFTSPPPPPTPPTQPPRSFFEAPPSSDEGRFLFSTTPPSPLPLSPP